MIDHYQAATVYFKALAHPIRLQILDMLRSGAVCVCHMEAVLGKRQAYISQQLMVLRDAGLVESRKDGLSVFYQMTDTVVSDLLDTALGPIKNNEPVVLDTCPCPNCAVAESEAISYPGERTSC